MATNPKDLQEKKLTLDARGRINVRPLLKHKGVTSVRAVPQEDGTITLRPIIDVELHPEEAWIYENPKILEGILEGIEDSKEGRVSELDVDFWKDIED